MWGRLQSLLFIIAGALASIAVSGDVEIILQRQFETAVVGECVSIDGDIFVVEDEIAVAFVENIVCLKGDTETISGKCLVELGI